MATDPVTSPDTSSMPLLPLRDVVVFPHMVIPLFVGRPKSIKALDVAMDAGKNILLVAQRSAAKDDPVAEDLYPIGSIATVLQMLKLPDGTVKVLVEGTQRAQVNDVTDEGEYLSASATRLDGDPGSAHEIEAMRRALLAQFDQYVKLNKKIPPEILTSMSGIDDGGRLADAIAAHLPLKLEQKQEILEMGDVAKRLEHLLGLLEGEVDILQVEKRIRGRVKRQMEKSQREYYLNEQVKAIQKELGEGEEGADLEEMEKRIKAARMPKEARLKAEAELKKLKLMSPMSAEATVVRNYLDTLVGLPWRKKSKISKDILAAEKVLDQDHYGLEKVKERIVEYLAVQSRVDQMKAPILCLVGPPGVGKTSLGQSIARATNRKFVRMSLGGVRDEAEIRGHRRTYIGAFPGQIIQMMKKAGTRNPVFLLDEVDKMAADFRGDPSAALLEVLDPEQNHAFLDHYLDTEYDLSDIMFIATANVMHTIPPALRDRMEVIRIAGYTLNEKLAIAQRYLVPKQIKAHGSARRRSRSRRRDPPDRRALHTRGRRPQPRARDRVDVPEGGPEGRGRKRREADAPHGRQGHRDAGRTALPPAARDRARPGGRRRHGARVDRGRRRDPQHRGDPDGRARQDHADGPAGRGHARVGTGRVVLHPDAGRRAGHRPAVLPQVRHPRSRSRRRDSEGRPLGRHHDRDGAGVLDDRRRGARRRRDDGRDHAAGQGAPDRRIEGEGARGLPLRHEDSRGSPRERAGSLRDPRRHQEGSDVPLG
jgi:Lon protease-like protein